MKGVEEYDSGQEFCNDLLNRRFEFTLAELAQWASKLRAISKEIEIPANYGEHCGDIICPRCGRRTIYYMRGFVMGCLADAGGYGAKPRVKIVKEETIPPHPEDGKMVMSVLR